MRHITIVFFLLGFTFPTNLKSQTIGSTFSLSSNNNNSLIQSIGQPYTNQLDVLSQNQWLAQGHILPDNGENIKSTSSQIAAYPNPFTSNITVVYDASQIQLEIIDSKGTMVYKNELNSINNKFQINQLQNLVPGLYFLNISSANQKSASVKLTKTNPN